MIDESENVADMRWFYWADLEIFLGFYYADCDHAAEHKWAGPFVTLDDARDSYLLSIRDAYQKNVKRAGDYYTAVKGQI